VRFAASRGSTWYREFVPALAFVCRAKGYRTLIVIADCFTESGSS
jgi:hypothetical protein